ncbi:TerC family protein [Salirhabdus sp. Marseille-P4669]|uniref:TerC family protein n=1 Tax=Salirhabdus sp. Marseille-P4669 TaxID=2042310 RepID=UPI001F2A2343|nr:TerC family protein [Salirhabdus sp. Marseille-P4669]
MEPMIQILLINLLLSGDNAIVIAMASRNLPNEIQRKAIWWGTAGAISMRVLFTFIMIHLLKMPFIHLIGGILLVYIAYKLLVDNQENHSVKSGESLKEAVTIIVFADVIMSLDNVLALTAIADSNLPLIIVGIMLSIPIILTASELFLKIINKYPIIIFIGAGLLAWTAGEMIIKEQRIQYFFRANQISELTVLTAITVFTVLVGTIKRGRI